MTISNKNRNIVFGIVCPTVSPVNLIVCQTCIHQMEEINVRTTYIAKPGEVERKWYVVDATDVPLGRLSAVVASDYVVVVNAEKVALTGRKDKNKIYYHHSNHPGGLKARTAGDYREKDPEKLIALSVKGMLPKGSLGRQQAKKLHVYRGADHKHAAQNPEVLDITNLI